MPLSDTDASRIAGLAGRFGAGKACDTEALAELRVLRERHGTPEKLQRALAVAYRACDERDALATLRVETLPAVPSDEQQLQAGAALIEATRYAEAVERLVPLAERQGPTSKAAWLAGFALLHAGRSDEARPWLEAAQAHGLADGRVDGHLLVGLARLHTGDTDGAIAELEAGVAKDPTGRLVLAALSRAYRRAGRVEDAEAISARAREAYAEVAADERTRLRLSALATELRDAQVAQRWDDALAVLDTMLPQAPPELAEQLRTLRVELLREAGRPNEDEDEGAAHARPSGKGDAP